MAADDAVLAVDRYTGEIAHVLVGTGQLVEQGGLSAVLVSDQGEFEQRTLGKRALVGLVVIFASLAKSRVGMRGVRLRHAGRRTGIGFNQCPFIQPFNFDPGSVRLAQGEGEPPHQQFHRVAQRRQLGQFHHTAGNHAHVEDMLAQGAFSAYRRDDGPFADR